ncbi:MAG: hypothetical protein D8M53_12210 [Armatimonadetes bacterium]|nr:hypothetical protein [Armatimonadota bacterium]
MEGLGPWSSPDFGPVEGLGPLSPPGLGPVPGFGPWSPPGLGPVPGFGPWSPPGLGPVPGFGPWSPPGLGPVPGFGPWSPPGLGPVPGFGPWSPCFGLPSPPEPLPGPFSGPCLPLVSGDLSRMPPNEVADRPNAIAVASARKPDVRFISISPPVGHSLRSGRLQIHCTGSSARRTGEVRHLIKKTCEGWGVLLAAGQSRRLPVERYQAGLRGVRSG